MVVAIIIIAVMFVLALISAFQAGRILGHRRTMAFFQELDVNKQSVVADLANRTIASATIPDVAGRDLRSGPDGVQLREEETEPTVSSSGATPQSSEDDRKGATANETESEPEDNNQEVVRTKRGFRRPSSQQARPRKPQKAKGSAEADPGAWKRWNA